MKDLFSQSFREQTFSHSETHEVLSHQKQIDHLITQAAPLWPIDKIAKIDLAILRLAIYELLIEKKNPPKVTIDEAVELAKEFGGDGGAPFVNGVLGTIVKNVK